VKVRIADWNVEDKSSRPVFKTSLQVDKFERHRDGSLRASELPSVPGYDLARQTGDSASNP